MLTLLINYDIIVNIILINYVWTICGMMMFPLTQNVAGSCTLAIWVLKQSMLAEKKAEAQFLYARYMGIETVSSLSLRTSSLGSCTLAIWVLKPKNYKYCIDIKVLVRSLYGY